MNKFIKIIMVLAFFIIELTSCDSNIQWIGDKKNYIYYTEYAEYNYYSSNGELVQTIVIDNEYDGNKILSSTITNKDIKSNTSSTTKHTYEYTDLICKHLWYSSDFSDYLLYYEETIEYLDHSYRHIKHQTSQPRLACDDGAYYTYNVTNNTYDGKCITQSHTQNYTCRNNETTPSGSSVTTYCTNGLYQTSTTLRFDTDGNLIDTSSAEYTYLNDEYWDYTECITKDSNGNESSRTIYAYNDSNRITEYKIYYDGKLHSQQKNVYNGENCLVSGFSGDLTIKGIARYIKIPTI